MVRVLSRAEPLVCRLVTGERVPVETLVETPVEVVRGDQGQWSGFCSGAQLP